MFTQQRKLLVVWLVLAGLLLFGGRVVRAVSEEGAAGGAVPVLPQWRSLGHVAQLLARPLAPAPPIPTFRVMPAALQVHHLSLGSLPRAAGPLSEPEGGAISSGTFMSVSPDVVRPNTTSAVALLARGFTANEPLQFYLNGTLALTPNADAGGFYAALLS